MSYGWLETRNFLFPLNTRNLDSIFSQQMKKYMFLFWNVLIFSLVYMHEQSLPVRGFSSRFQICFIFNYCHTQFMQYRHFLIQCYVEMVYFYLPLLQHVILMYSVNLMHIIIFALHNRLPTLITKRQPHLYRVWRKKNICKIKLNLTYANHVQGYKYKE